MVVFERIFGADWKRGRIFKICNESKWLSKWGHSLIYFVVYFVSLSNMSCKSPTFQTSALSQLYMIYLGIYTHYFGFTFIGMFCKKFLPFIIYKTKDFKRSIVLNHLRWKNQSDINQYDGVLFLEPVNLHKTHL